MRLSLVLVLLLAGCASENRLAVGRIVTVSAIDVKSFAVANDNIEVKLTPDGKDFVVIGKKAGRADLLLVRRDGTKKTITYEVGAP